MKRWCTEIFAKHNVHGEFCRFLGPNIPAPTAEIARQWCEQNAGYLHVTGDECIAEIPCKEGTFEPDWNQAINYDVIQNN